MFSYFQIFYHNGVTSNRDDFEICARVENVDLPKQGYFGVSAATGALAGELQMNSADNVCSSTNRLAVISLVIFLG